MAPPCERHDSKRKERCRRTTMTKTRLEFDRQLARKPLDLYMRSIGEPTVMLKKGDPHLTRNQPRAMLASNWHPTSVPQRDEQPLTGIQPRHDQIFGEHATHTQPTAEHVRYKPGVHSESRVASGRPAANRDSTEFRPEYGQGQTQAQPGPNTDCRPRVQPGHGTDRKQIPSLG